MTGTSNLREGLLGAGCWPCRRVLVLVAEVRRTTTVRRWAKPFLPKSEDAA